MHYSLFIFYSLNVVNFLYKLVVFIFLGKYTSYLVISSSNSLHLAWFCWFWYVTLYNSSLYTEGESKEHRHILFLSLNIYNPLLVYLVYFLRMKPIHESFGINWEFEFTAMNWQTAMQVTGIVLFCQTNLNKVHLHWNSFVLLVFKNALSGLGCRKTKCTNKCQATWCMQLQRQSLWWHITKWFWQ